MGLITGQFNDSFQPIMDGVANVVKNYVYWLNKKYGQSCMVTPSFPAYKDTEDFEVIRYNSIALPNRPPYRLGMPQLDLAFRKKVNCIPFSIVHAHCPFGSGRIALNIAKRRGIPIIATFHSKYYDDFKEVVRNKQIAQLLLKKVMDFYNSVDFVWTVNKATVNTLRDYGYNGAVEVVYNGTDFLPLDDLQKRIDLVNCRLNLFPDDLVFLFVGQHIWQKNLKMLVQSLRYLKDKGVSFKMLFVGKGYAENDLKQMVTELGLADSVMFLGMVLDRDYLVSLFARSNLFLFPSIYDNAPIVVKEAAAVKCPTLAIENSNTAEGIIDGFNGFLSSDDPLVYASKIREITADKQVLSRVGDAASDTLYKNWEKIIDEVNERYIDILNTYNRYNKTMNIKIV